VEKVLEARDVQQAGTKVASLVGLAEVPGELLTGARRGRKRLEVSGKSEANSIARVPIGHVSSLDGNAQMVVRKGKNAVLVHQTILQRVTQGRPDRGRQLALLGRLQYLQQFRFSQAPASRPEH